MRRLLCVVFALAVLPAARAGDDKALRFVLKFDEAVSAKPFTGRVYILLNKQEPRSLPSGPNWFNPEPFFARDVSDWKPGAPLEIDAKALGYPGSLAKLTKGTYWATAVMDFDRGDRSFAAADGNGHSKPVKFTLDPASSGPVGLTIDQVYKGRAFTETERVKLVDIPSKLLSDFHKRPVRMRAGVVLPKSFAKNPDKRYPVIYEIPGFGGTHTMAQLSLNRTDVAGVEMIYVVLDPSCRLGHHVFADSDNNGPVGKALCEELIPFIEKTYRGLGAPTARFVTGHSSGGWSSLWLQVTYPDFFGGTWSTAPDPVDFRDFQKVNIYQPKVNIFKDERGSPRPLARQGGKVMVYYKPFSDMEDVMGRGGQLMSFEAVFSPKGADGKPRPLWDRATGTIDPETARTWERYDIRLILESNWKSLGPKLGGKLHVYMGDADNFYLEGATLLLKKSLASLGSDAVVELFPGRDHSTLMSPDLRRRIAQEMADTFRKNHK